MPTANVGKGNYTVKKGDCMASIAVEHGFHWQTLWDLGQNADLKRVRKDPYVLLPGDQVYIPNLRLKEQDCATDQMHKFVVKGVPEKFKVVITDDEDKPMPNQPYVLVIDKKQTYQGQTDGEGGIEHPIPPNAKQAHLVVGQDDDVREYHIGLGVLDPIDEVSGLQARLLNLGYYDGNVDGQFNSQTRTALLLFQETHKLPLTGKNDPDTQTKIKQMYGC